MNVFDVLLATLGIRDTKVVPRSTENLRSVGFENLLLENLGFEDEKTLRGNSASLYINVRQSIFSSEFRELMALMVVNYPVSALHACNFSSGASLVKEKPVLSFQEKNGRKDELLSITEGNVVSNLNISDLGKIREGSQLVINRIGVSIEAGERLGIQVTTGGFPYQLRKLRKKVYPGVNSSFGVLKKLHSEALNIDQKKNFSGGREGSGVKAFSKLMVEGAYLADNKSDLKKGLIYLGFANYRNHLAVGEIRSSLNEGTVSVLMSTKSKGKNPCSGLECSGFYERGRGSTLKRRSLKKKSSFPPGKLPSKWGAASDRRSSPPVHLFEQTSGSSRGSTYLLSDTATNLQHKENYQFYGTFSGKENTSQMSFSCYSSSYLHANVFSWSFDSSSGFNGFESGGDSLFKNGQIEEEKSVFRLSYADKHFKLSVSTQGKVLNLNLNFLDSFRIDPSVVKDIASIIEDSGFIPGKITLKQKKERYTYSDRRVDSKLELKV